MRSIAGMRRVGLAGALVLALARVVCSGEVAPPDPTAPFSFVVFGDNQFATGSPTSGVPERMALPKVVVALKPTLVLHTGDLMDHGYDAGAYERFAEYYQDLLAAAPFFPTMGNHDAGKGIGNYGAFLEEQVRHRNAAVYGAEAYARDLVVRLRDDPVDYPTRFSDPGVAAAKRLVPSGVSFKTYYSVRFRNACFISLEQGTRWWANTPLAWLERTLREAREQAGIDHLVVFMHHPMYSSTMPDSPPDPAAPGSGECMLPVRRIYEDLFRRYDVTLVFSGHAHLYDRFWVPDDGTPTRVTPPPPRYPHDGASIHYIVTGGGGGPLNSGGWREESSWAFTQNRICAYHVVEVQVEGRQLTVRAQRVSGTAEQPVSTLFEQFTVGP